MMDFTARAEVAQKAMRAAGEMLRTSKNFAVRQKAANDFVTEMDVKSEKMLREALLGAFPEDAFYGEESGQDTQADGRWIVDPIDGTQSFMRGQYGYTISVAYEYRGVLELGCVYVPEVDEMFVALRGGGAALNGAPIHVSDISEPKLALAHCGYCHRQSELRDKVLLQINGICREISDLRRYGSAALALCFVACGRSEAFFEKMLKPYDIAAGIVLVREAGGAVGDWEAGKNCLETGNIIATNGVLQDFFTATLAREA